MKYSMKIAYRITPARAGKSDFVNVLVSLLPDHPRTRGEKFFGLPGSGKTMGSPPHARGKAVKVVNTEGQWGITPARAGKRLYMATILGYVRDHPRTRGEKST